jgi:hypothetical protein
MIERLDWLVIGSPPLQPLQGSTYLDSVIRGSPAKAGSPLAEICCRLCDNPYATTHTSLQDSTIDECGLFVMRESVSFDPWPIDRPKPGI